MYSIVVVYFVYIYILKIPSWIISSGPNAS